MLDNIGWSGLAERRRLQLAAPEMLAALEQVAAELIHWGDDSLETFNLTSALEQVLAAIRSAKGEA